MSTETKRLNGEGGGDFKEMYSSQPYFGATLSVACSRLWIAKRCIAHWHTVSDLLAFERHMGYL